MTLGTGAIKGWQGATLQVLFQCIGINHVLERFLKVIFTNYLHLLSCNGYSTEFIPYMVAGGPLGGRPPDCCDWMKANRVVSP